MADSDQIVFIQYHEPGLKSGDYRIHAELSVQNLPAQVFGDAKGQLQQKTYESERYLRVAGDRFALSPGSVDSVYPPAGSSGNFSRALPHVVLSRPTLPWERTVSETATAHTPWLAILLLTEEELRDEKLELAQPTTRGSRTDGSVAIDCDLLTISGKRWSSLAPFASEVPLLAHVRRALPALKNDTPEEILEYGLVIGNRLPPANSSCWAFLVSLEDMEKWLPPAPAPQTVTLVVLHSWRFFAEKETHSFGEVIRALDHGVGLSLPDRGSGVAAAPLTMGYIPVPHHLRVGGQTWSWYRGPFTPYGTKRRIKKDPHKPIVWGDGVLLYDPELSMMDVSCASAWALGRLMALNDTSFATTLYKSNRENVRSTIERVRFRMAFGKLAGPSVAEASREQIDRELAQALTTALPRLSGAQRSAPEDANAASNFALPQKRLSAAERALQLRDALTQEASIAELHHLGERVGLLRTHDVEASDPSAPETIIAQWLGNLILLKGVPVHYLIPDERMLPNESIRFFQVDESWLESLRDGALSIGRVTATDLSHDVAFMPLLSTTTERATAVARPQTQRLVAAQTAPPMVKPLSGFLLRSQAIAQWPNMEVEGSANGATVVTLRQQNIGPLLICLFDGVVDTVEVFQPSEGVHFGFLPEDNPVAKKRRNQSGKEWEENPLDKIRWRNEKTRVLDIGELVKWMAGTQSPHYRSDQFALQMVTGVDRVVFTIQAPRTT
jgi:hypothetical protein